MKRITGLLLALVMLLVLAPLPARAAAYRSSGTDAVPKLSQKEIQTLFSEDFSAPDLFVEEPHVTAPYAPGKMHREPQEKALHLLNAIRRLSGLSPVELSQNYCELSQYGAVILAKLGGLTHTPEKPDDMAQDFYEKAYESTYHSNIAGMKGFGASNPLAASVKMYMDDSDQYNVERLGHRRWLLSADLGRTGFGCARTGDGWYYTPTYVMNYSQPVKSDFDFISWPASGNFPTQLFEPDYYWREVQAWSVTLNPDYYAMPVMEEITVTIQGEGERYVLSGRDTYFPAGTGAYLNVDLGGYGAEGNAIIFRPEKTDSYKGLYTVTIDGLRDKSGAAVDFSYQVNFFDLNDVPTDPEPVEPQNPFRDVEKDDYFYDSVLWAVEHDITAGVTDTAFDPQAPCTRAQNALFLWRYQNRPKPVNWDNPFQDVKDDAYYTDAVLWAVEQDITTGYGDCTFRPYEYCTRAHAITFLWRMAGCPKPKNASNPFVDVRNGYYRDAVLWAVENGITTGVSTTSFAPNKICTRAEILTFLYRFDHTSFG